MKTTAAKPVLFKEILEKTASARVPAIYNILAVPGFTPLSPIPHTSIVLFNRFSNFILEKGSPVLDQSDINLLRQVLKM